MSTKTHPTEIKRIASTYGGDDAVCPICGEAMVLTELCVGNWLLCCKKNGKENRHFLEIGPYKFPGSAYKAFKKAFCDPED